MLPLQSFVISDLHLGGAPASAQSLGFQMCPPESRRRLARFIAHIDTHAEKQGEVELLINGDFVDFLAEEPFDPFTRSSPAAVAKLRAIIEHCDALSPEGERVFPALQQFVARGHRLTLLLGNHDVELAVPAVRQELMQYLTGGRPARVEFLLDGEACLRGEALIEHGNRYDTWNAVAHGELRAYRARVSRGEPQFPFTPPAGSLLVASVMNPLKRLYRFIDLLKPENEAVVPILCALHPEAVLEIRRIWASWRARADVGSIGEVPEQETLIASRGTYDIVPDELAIVGASAESAAAVLPDQHSTRFSDLADDPDALLETERLLCQAEGWLAESIGGADVVPEAQTQIGDSPLAWMRSTLSLLRMAGADRRRRYQHLRDALVAHRRTIGSTFALDKEEERYLKAADRLARGNVRIVVFGHTHFARRVPLCGERLYLNTGTWCPTIRLSESLYAAGANDANSQALLQRFVEDLGANQLRDWTSLQTVFARITVSESGKTTAELCEFRDDGQVVILPAEAA